MNHINTTATLDATSICNDIAEMTMPVSESTAPSGSLSALFAGIEPATLDSTPVAPSKKIVKKSALVKKSAPKAEPAPAVPAPTPVVIERKPEPEIVAKPESKKAPKLPPLTTVEDVLQPDLLSHSQDSHGAKTPKSNSMASVAEKANQKLIDDILRHDDVPPKYTEENLSKKSYSELKNLYDDLKDGDDWDDD